MNSIFKCNTFYVAIIVKEYLIWCCKAHGFARSVIQTVHCILNTLTINFSKVHFSWKVLAKEAVGVLIQPPFPSMKGMGKVMGVLSKKLAGKAAGSEMSRIVKEELGKMQQAPVEK